MKNNSVILFLLFGLCLFILTLFCWPMACLMIWIMDFQGPYAGAFLGALTTTFLVVAVGVNRYADETGLELPPFTKKDEDEQREDDEDEINKDK